MHAHLLAVAPRDGARVLLVEDESRIAQFVAKGLEASGLDVTVAEDGDVGAFLAATEPYDLVLLDLGLPGTPGLEILRLMRQDRPATPVVLLTAADEPLARQTGLAAGATEYLTKPFVFEDLCALVRRLLRIEEADTRGTAHQGGR